MLDFMYYFAIFYLLMGLFIILIAVAMHINSGQKADEKPIRIILNLLLVLLFWYPLGIVDVFRR